jgi:phosphoglycerate dehydrogenase-like enzyme
MNKKILVSYVELSAENFSKLSSHYEVYTPSSPAFEVVKKDAEAVLCISLNEGELKKLEKLRFIQVLSAGVDSLAWHAIPENVIVAGNMGSNADAVAEHTWALILALTKKLHHYLPKVREGDFSRDEELLQLKGRTLCIVGMGAIGRRVAEVGKAFKMRVVGVTRSGRPDPSADIVYSSDRLGDALREADVVVLSAPLTKETRGLLGLERLRLLKKGCVLVNVGRAELVDREALKTYIKENPQILLATDVWWRYEKNRPWEEELTKHPNFIGTPWIAGAFGSREVLEHMFKSAIENLLKYASGEKPSNVVDRNLYV